jgi:hypothetical protein
MTIAYTVTEPMSQVAFHAALTAFTQQHGIGGNWFCQKADGTVTKKGCSFAALTRLANADPRHDVAATEHELAVTVRVGGRDVTFEARR